MSKQDNNNDEGDDLPVSLEEFKEEFGEDGAKEEEELFGEKDYIDGYRGGEEEKDPI